MAVAWRCPAEQLHALSGPLAPSRRIGFMDSAHARQLLERERRRIKAELDRLMPSAGGELSHIDQHPADDGTDLFERERDQSLAEQLQAQLAAIERAEERLKKGVYGLSVESGEPIPDARLEAHPWAERTAEEQVRYEASKLA